mgnify:CR=1 FL=1
MSKTVLFIDGENFLHKIEEIIEKDLVEEQFPLYHSPEKLAKAVVEQL